MKPTRNLPLLMEARVVNVDVANRRLIVDIPSAQIVGLGVKMAVHGPADGYRVSHSAMPGRGTYGLVAFPANDPRSGIWISAHYPALNTALTTNTDQFAEYNSHWSGAYEFLQGDGQWTKSFPDGTFIQVAVATAKPNMFRQTVDENQVQQLTKLTDQDRVPSTPQPRQFIINHATGTTVVIDANGNTTVTGVKGTAITFTVNGATVTIDKNGAIDMNTASGQAVNVSAGGGATQFTLVRTDEMVAKFNAHTHHSGATQTTTPDVHLVATDIQSAMFNVSE